MAFLAVVLRVPCQPCAAALIDTNNSYDCCSGTVDSGHEDFSRVRRNIERHCLGFLLGSAIRNEIKERPSNGRAIAPGTQLLLSCLVGESVGR